MNLVIGATAVLALFLAGFYLTTDFRDKKKWLIVAVCVIVVVSWYVIYPSLSRWRNEEKELTATLPSAFTASKAGDHWELCWEEYPETKGVDPNLRNYCCPVTRLVEVGDTILTIETIRGYNDKRPGAVLIWNQTSKKGVWFTDQTQTDRGGEWWLVKMSNSLYAGHYTDTRGEQYAMSIHLK